MSRCFPFPPLGYEKKPQSDHIELLLKKHKEKKHKKEKTEKEKREGKERKDRDKVKDRSKDKHREKKEKREKQRDKDKKKGKGRTKDDKRILFERKDGEHTEGHNDRKHGEDSRREDLKIAKSKEEIGRRDEERGAGNRIGENDAGKVQRRFDGMGISADKARGTCNEIVRSITIPEQKRMDMASAMEERVAGNEMDQSSVSADQKRFDGMGRLVDEDANKKAEGKEMPKEQKVDGRKGEKHKDKDGEKKHKAKDKVRNKEKEKEEKVEEKGEHKHKEKDKPRDSLKKEQVGLQNTRSLCPLKDDVKGAGADGCAKRKEANGFLHENEVRPNKLPRPPSSQLSLENGNKSEQNRISNLCALDKHEPLNMVNVEKTLGNKERKRNGVIDVHSPLNTRHPLHTADATKNGETSRKSPHPDEKHLSQLLCVPKMEEWLEVDDQEWLLSRDYLRLKPKTMLEADLTPKVWAEAVWIESADVLALPYVIPY